MSPVSILWRQKKADMPKMISLRKRKSPNYSLYSKACTLSSLKAFFWTFFKMSTDKVKPPLPILSPNLITSPDTMITHSWRPFHYHSSIFADCKATECIKDQFCKCQILLLLCQVSGKQIKSNEDTNTSRCVSSLLCAVG